MPRRIWQALVAAAVVLTLAGAAAAQATWETFTHPQHGFSLKYPSDWEADGGKDPLVFLAVGPLASGMSSFRINVNVVMESVPADITVERYEASSESQMGLLFQGYRRLRTDRTTVGNVPALLRYYTWRRNDGLELYQMQLNVVSRGRAYIVTGTTSTQSSQLEREAELLVRILQTFRTR
ncbi:MAG: DcrB-related protein [bacterium]